MRFTEQVAIQRAHAPYAQKAKAEYDARLKPCKATWSPIARLVVSYRNMGWSWVAIANSLHISTEQARFDYQSVVSAN